MLHMAYVRQPPPFLQAPISRQQSHLEHSGVGQSWGDLPSSVVGLDLNIFSKSKLSGKTLSLRFFVDNQTRGECGWTWLGCCASVLMKVFWWKVFGESFLVTVFGERKTWLGCRALVASTSSSFLHCGIDINGCRIQPSSSGYKTCKIHTLLIVYVSW